MLGLRPRLKARPSLLDLIREGSIKGSSDTESSSDESDSDSPSDRDSARSPDLQSPVGAARSTPAAGTASNTGPGGAEPATGTKTNAASGASFVSGGTGSATSLPPPPSPVLSATAIKLPLLRNSPPPTPSPSSPDSSPTAADRELDNVPPLQSLTMPSVCALPISPRTSPSTVTRASAREQTTAAEAVDELETTTRLMPRYVNHSRS